MSEFAPIPGVTVIGFGHKARHGKDTAARAIIESVGSRVAMRFSFADDLYAVARVMHGMTTKDAPLLQGLGVEAREKDPNVWIRSVYTKIAEARPVLALITDVRFPNELEFVKRLGGSTVRVRRFIPNDDNKWSLYLDSTRPANHISEVALDDADWDYDLINVESRPAVLAESANNLARFVMLRDQAAAVVCR